MANRRKNIRTAFNILAEMNRQINAPLPDDFVNDWMPVYDTPLKHRIERLEAAKTHLDTSMSQVEELMKPYKSLPVTLLAQVKNMKERKRVRKGQMTKRLKTLGKIK